MTARDLWAAERAAYDRACGRDDRLIRCECPVHPDGHYIPLPEDADGAWCPVSQQWVEVGEPPC